MIAKRKTFFSMYLQALDKKYKTGKELKVAKSKGEYKYTETDDLVAGGLAGKYNLVSSRIATNATNLQEWHFPCIDMDYPVFAVPSRTPGHTHLYIERAVSWTNYKKLLKALLECGLIEQGYYNASIGHGMTLLRSESYDQLNKLLENKQLAHEISETVYPDPILTTKEVLKMLGGLEGEKDIQD